MPWRLPSRIQTSIRNLYSFFLSTDQPLKQKRLVLFLLLRPALGWVKTRLVSAGLEPEEAESELFLMVARLLLRYDSSKAALLVYLHKSIPWESRALIRKQQKFSPEVLSGLVVEEGFYEEDQEVGISIPDILFDNRWMLRDLPRHEKLLILRMLTEDDLGCRTLADKCQVSKSTINHDLQILAGKLKGRFQ